MQLDHFGLYPNLVLNDFTNPFDITNILDIDESISFFKELIQFQKLSKQGHNTDNKHGSGPSF